MSGVRERGPVIDHGPVARPKLWLAGRTAAVAGHVLAEKITRPTPRTRADVPVSGTDVTPEWLTDVLCREQPGAEVLAVDFPGGSSGTSTRAALRLTYNDAGGAAGLPTELFAKTSTTLSQRVLLGGAHALDGETHFFMDYRNKVEMEAPRGYFGAVDPASWRSIVLMEDIAATKGAEFIHPTTPLTRAQVEDLVQNLAAYHGALWADESLGKLKTPRDHLRNVKSFIDMEKRCTVGIRRARDVMPEALRDRADDLWRGVELSLELATTQGPPTLLHGDSHVGQTYICADGRMGLTDWQVCQRGCWGYDLAYLLGSALPVEERREWDRDLLALYLEKLAAAGGDAPAFDDAWLTFRQMLLYPLAAWTFTIGRAATQPKMQPEDVCRPIIERLAHAVDDLDSLAALGI